MERKGFTRVLRIAAGNSAPDLKRLHDAITALATGAAASEYNTLAACLDTMGRLRFGAAWPDTVPSGPPLLDELRKREADTRSEPVSCL